MGLVELFLIAVGLSMDAFAVAVTLGLSMQKVTLKKCLIVGLYFGIFQGGMPLIGYLLGAQFINYIQVFDHWIAFALLAIIGGKMIWESFHKDDDAETSDEKKTFDAQDATEHNFNITASKIQQGALNRTKSAKDSSANLGPKKMLPLAIATSIDALAVGISFALMEVNIIFAVLSIGLVTLVLSMVAVSLGKVFGGRFKSRAELAGGIILVLIGLKILLEHLGVLF